MMEMEVVENNEHGNKNKLFIGKKNKGRQVLLQLNERQTLGNWVMGNVLVDDYEYRKRYKMNSLKGDRE